MRTLRFLGDPYTDEDIKGAADAVAGKSELDAIVAYLQGLGINNVETARQPASVATPVENSDEVAVPPATP
jgi:cytochrome c oxidase cbb3-type subunit 2